MKTNRFNWVGLLCAVTLILAILVVKPLIMGDPVFGPNLTTPLQDGRKCATCFRRAKSIKQIDKCQRKMDAYMEAWSDKGVRPTEMSEFAMEAMKGLDDIDWANLR